jgi:protein-tyrosine phosphatase
LTITLADQQDLILAADRWNLRDAQAIVASGNRRAEVRLIRDFDPAAQGSDLDDPWGRSESAYERAAEEILAALPGILESLRAR